MPQLHKDTHKRHTNEERTVHETHTSAQHTTSENGHQLRKSHTNTQVGCLSCVCFNVLAQGVVSVTRQVPGNITPYITPCRSRLQSMAIDTQSVTRLGCFVFGCAIVTSENGTSIQFHPQLIAWFSLVLNERGQASHATFSLSVFLHCQGGDALHSPSNFQQGDLPEVTWQMQ